MPNLISQLRSGMQPSLNNKAIQDTKDLMNAVRLSANPQKYLLNMLNGNPQLASILKGGNLKSIAEQMAQAQGINLNELINQLQGGT